MHTFHPWLKCSNLWVKRWKRTDGADVTIKFPVFLLPWETSAQSWLHLCYNGQNPLVCSAFHLRACVCVCSRSSFYLFTSDPPWVISSDFVVGTLLSQLEKQNSHGFLQGNPKFLHKLSWNIELCGTYLILINMEFEFIRFRTFFYYYYYHYYCYYYYLFVPGGLLENFFWCQVDQNFTPGFEFSICVCLTA